MTEKTKLKSIVTQTYISNPETHTVTATNTRTTNEVYNELLTFIEEHENMDMIDYILKANQLDEPLPINARFICNTDWGGSEGVYTDILLGDPKATAPVAFATIKTLGETADDFLRMSHIGAIAHLLLNGNGKEYDITADLYEDEKSRYAIEIDSEADLE